MIIVIVSLDNACKYCIWLSEITGNFHYECLAFQIHKFLSTESYEQLKLLILSLASINALLHVCHSPVFLVLKPSPQHSKKKKHSYKLPVWGAGSSNWLFLCSNLLSYGWVLGAETHAWVAGHLNACLVPCRAPGLQRAAVLRAGDAGSALCHERQNDRTTGTAEFGKGGGFGIKKWTLSDTAGAGHHSEGPEWAAEGTGSFQVCQAALVWGSGGIGLACYNRYAHSTQQQAWSLNSRRMRRTRKRIFSKFKMWSF